MSEIRRTSLPHSLCRWDVLGAAKTVSGKTLAFIIPILVLDEADRILDAGFKKVLDSILSQLPRKRQTLLFSATQTKSVKDLARLSLTDPEYLSVHAESKTATPGQLEQTAMVVPIEQKLDLLWTFIKTHLNSKMLVFLSSCKQVKFVFETFKKLRPGVPLLCLHGRMNQTTRLAVCSQFREEKCVLFSTDVASRGLDIPSVDWVVQVDCPEDVATYVHRVGRTARFKSRGRAVLFLATSESEMLKKLEAQRIPIRTLKVNPEKFQKVSDSLASLLVKYPNLEELARTAFTRYLKSIYLQKDKEVFDVQKLPIEEFSASLGLPLTPKVRFLRQKIGQKSNIEKTGINVAETRKPKPNIKEQEDDILRAKEEEAPEDGQIEVPLAVASSLKKNKKLKINTHKPFGTRVVFDKEGNSLLPLAALANQNSVEGTIQLDKVEERYKKLKEDMKGRDAEDKKLLKKRLREKRTKEKTKMKQGTFEDGDEISESYEDTNNGVKRTKIRFESESEDEKTVEAISDSVTLAEQEALALKLLSSMHS